MKHKHHIIPRHIGGTDDPSNLVELTVEEHAEAHRLLWEEHNRIEDYYAWQGLLGNIVHNEIFLELMKSDQIRSKISTGVRKFWNNLTDEERQKRIDQFNSSKIGNQNAKGMTYTHSEEAKNKISKARLGKCFITEDGKKRISEYRKKCVGRKHSAETIEKMRQSALNRKKRVNS